MSERPASPPTPEQSQQLNNGLFEQRGQLPPGHRVSMIHELYTLSRAGEYRLWPRSSIAVMEQANLTGEKMPHPNDEHSRHISHEIVRYDSNDVFWDELEYMARKP